MPRLVLYVGPQFFAKADHHGLVAKKIAQKNARLVTHWVLPTHPAAAPTDTASAPQDSAYNVTPSGGATALANRLADPATQRMLSEILSGAQQHDTSFMGHETDDEDDELYDENGDIRLDALYRQTDWDDVGEAVNYLLAANRYDGAYEVTFDLLDGASLGSAALDKTISGHYWSDSEEDQTSKEMWEAYAASGPELNWDAEYGGRVGIVAGPERAGELGDFRAWAENEGYDEDAIDEAEGHERDLENEWERELAGRLTEAWSASDLPNRFKADFAPARSGNGSHDTEDEQPLPAARPFGPHGTLTTEDFIHACGLPHGSNVSISEVSGSEGSLSFRIQGTHDELGITLIDRTVHVGRRDHGEGYRYIENNHFKLREDAQGQRTGAKVLMKEALEMQRLGFEHMRTHAYRSDSTGYVGYYTWIRLGYNGDIPSACRRKIAEEYKELTGESLPADVDSLQKLIRVPHGLELWKRYGDSVHVRFDTTAASRAVGHLEQYLQTPVSDGATR